MLAPELSLPNHIISDRIACYLNFTDSVNVRMSSKSLNSCFKYKHDPRLDNQCAIKAAAAAGKADAIRCLLQVQYVDPSFDNNYAIRIAARRNHLEVVRILLNDTRVDPAAEHNQALTGALYSSNGELTEIVQLLLDDPRVDPTDLNNLALTTAAYHGIVPTVKALIQRGVNPSFPVNTALILASMSGHVDLVRFLLENDDIDPSFPENKPLIEAISNGNLEMVRLFLEYVDQTGQGRTVDPSIPNNLALKIATENGFEEIRKLLLQDPRVLQNGRL